MFGPRDSKIKNDSKDHSADTEESSTELSPRMEHQSGALTRTASPASSTRMPGVTRRPSSGAVDASSRRLVVGEGLSLSGEITSCDVLVVAGKVEAKLTDGKLLEINETGQFRGSVEIENADIGGRYDGQLVVHGRLTVRSTGRISGMIKYGELEVNAGGQIIGEMQVVGGANAQHTTGGFKSAAKFTSTTTTEEGDASSLDRKSA